MINPEAGRDGTIPGGLDGDRRASPVGLRSRQTRGCDPGLRRTAVAVAVAVK